MQPWSNFIGVGLLAAAVGGVAWVTQRPNPAPAIAFVQKDCASPPRWTPVWSSGEGAIRPEGEGWFMAGRSALSARVCTPGRLNIAAEGESAQGHPELIIILDGQELAVEPIEGRRQVTVRVPRAGGLQVLYLNDFYESVYRQIVLRRVRQDVAGCRQAVRAINVPTVGGGGWDAESNYGSLVTSEPSTVELCGAGLLFLSIQGKAAEGVYPTLRIEQAGKVLREVRTQAQAQEISVEVTAQPVLLSLVNPLRREVADRNIRALRLVFLPQ